MRLTFLLLAALTLGSALLALSRRRLVHCALWVAVSFAALACLYLQLGAQFIGFAQVLVYVGAVAILIVFAILLTRSTEEPAAPAVIPGWLSGISIAVLTAGGLVVPILSSSLLPAPPAAPPMVTAQALGQELMTRYVLVLEVAGLLLTAALIGAVILALKESEGRP